MKNLYFENDWDYVWEGVRRNVETGEIEKATGLTGLTAHLSATRGGDTIHAELTKDLVERTDADHLGQYFAVVDGDDLRTHLDPTYVGTVVFEVVGDGENVFYSAPRRVMAIRIP
jgi:hypothetical protein